MAVKHHQSKTILYSDESGIYSHQVRMVLEEKGVEYDVEFLKPEQSSATLLTLNPYNTLPTLVDRNLALYNAPIIIAYLDERFPHPPLMPAFAVGRAECRRLMFRIEHDLCRRIHDLDLLSGEDLKVQQHRLVESIIAFVNGFEGSKYFFENEFSLVDCLLAPIIWRLPSLGVDTPELSKAISNYCERVFSRDSFQRSLTEAERALRDANI